MRKLLVTLFITSISFANYSNAKKLSEIENAKNHSGYIDIIYDEGEAKTYLKIDNIGEELIYQTSLPSGLGSNDIGLDRGQLGETRLVVFERAGNKLFLKQKPTSFRAITDNPTEATAIDEAFASSILWGFEIEDSGVDQDRSWVLVDASEFLLQDIHGVGRHLEKIKQGTGYTVDSSRSAADLTHTNAFPNNTELQATVTLVGTKPGDYLKDTAPNPYAITLNMHHSFIRLPDGGYQTREFFPKSGYWAVQYQDYAQPINQSINKQLIGRHRLQKKTPNALQSDAIKPIIYYIDPGVPEPVRSALIDGASWWNSAFEEIGYKDAFQVKMLPLGADPMDVRYNVIQWVHRSTRGWSYGSSVIDPRTGEIIKGHVTLGSLRVRQDYLIAQGLMAPFGDTENDQALMDLALARIRQLSAHEVGHTLGLNHNFAASNYGRESVMDYPHPQFEIEGDSIVAPNAYGVGLGKWDNAAIAYGYSEFADDKNERSELLALITKNDDDGLIYITDSDARDAGSPHANASLWDNGADAVAELKEMLTIRKTALANFGANNLKVGRNWSDLEEIFVPVYYFHRFQIQAAAKWLGGISYDYGIKKQGQEKPILGAVSGEQQYSALSAMLQTLTPEFLGVSPSISSIMVPKASENYRSRESIEGDTGVSFDQIALAAASAQHTIGLMLHPQRLARLGQQNAVDDSIPSINDIGSLLHDEIIAKNYTGMNANIHQAVVDTLYSNYLNIIHSKDVSSWVKMQILGVLHSESKFLSGNVKRQNKDSSYYGFYTYQANRLADFTSDVEDKLIDLPKMPPGSPI